MLMTPNVVLPLKCYSSPKCTQVEGFTLCFLQILVIPVHHHGDGISLLGFLVSDSVY